MIYFSLCTFSEFLARLPKLDNHHFFNYIKDFPFAYKQIAIMAGEFAADMISLYLSLSLLVDNFLLGFGSVIAD